MTLPGALLLARGYTMNKELLCLILTSFFLLSSFPPAEARRVATLSIGKGEATVSFLTGTAEVLEKGTWTPLNIKDTIGEGDQVRTKTGAKMELILSDKSRIRFAGDSEFKVSRIEGGGASSTPRDVKFHVVLGRVWSNITQAVGKKEKFELSCFQAVAGVRGTIYRMNVEQDRSALVRVYDGTVYVSGGEKSLAQPVPIGPPTKIAGPKPIPGPHKVSMEEWTVIIRAMQQIKIGVDGIPEKPRDFTKEEDRDEWVDWNRAMDRETQ
jgi:hypothetical protein